MNWYHIKYKQKNTTEVFHPSLFMEMNILCIKSTVLGLNHLLPTE